AVARGGGARAGGVADVLPDLPPSHPARYAFFTHGLYKRCIPGDETVAIFSNSPLWQAETAFRFRVAAGGLAPIPENAKPLTGFDAELFLREAGSNYARPTMERMLGWAAYHGVA